MSWIVEQERKIQIQYKNGMGRYPENINTTLDSDKINVDLEIYDTPNELIGHLEKYHCSDDCMVEKRKEKGLPEIEDCPPIQDATYTEQQIVLSRESFAIYERIYNKHISYEKSMWYKLWKFFN